MLQGAARPPSLAELIFRLHSVACLSSLGPTVLFSMFSSFPDADAKVCDQFGVCSSGKVFVCVCDQFALCVSVVNSVSVRPGKSDIEREHVKNGMSVINSMSARPK